MPDERQPQWIVLRCRTDAGLTEATYRFQILVNAIHNSSVLVDVRDRNEPPPR